MQIIDRYGFGPEEPPIPQPTVQNQTVDPEDTRKAMRESMDFFAAICTPLVFKYYFPDLFKLAWQWLTSASQKHRDFSQLALGLPRGFGKTMVIKLFVAYCVLFTNKRFVLIVCGTQTKANNVLADVASILDEPNIKKLFGDWKANIDIERQDQKVFSFRGRKIILAAAGANADIRGITINNDRPDLMIFDDIQTRQEANSEQVSSDLETWMYGTAMKAKSPEGCLFVFIANMYPTKWSLLRRIKHNPNWVKFIVGGITADGKSLWEDLQPLAQLLREYQNDLSSGHPEVFHAEVLNDENASVNGLIDISKIPANPFGPDDLHTHHFIIIDPATDKERADEVSIGYFRVFDGKPVLWEVIEDRLSPGGIAYKAIKMALKWNCRAIGIESNAFQYALHWVFKTELERYQIQGIITLELYSGRASKNSRIVIMFQKLLKGEIYYTAECSSPVISQIVSFNPLITKNTDGVLDLLTYAPKMLELYPQQTAIELHLLDSSGASAEVVEDVVFTSGF